MASGHSSGSTTGFSVWHCFKSFNFAITQFCTRVTRRLVSLSFASSTEVSLEPYRPDTKWTLRKSARAHRSFILGAGPGPELASRLSLCAVDAGVPFEVLLCDPVEGERGNRALQERSRHTPCAAGAAPAAEVVAVDPDQVFVHGTCLCVSGSLFRL
jgi:hypothetical protein